MKFDGSPEMKFMNSNATERVQEGVSARHLTWRWGRFYKGRSKRERERGTGGANYLRREGEKAKFAAKVWRGITRQISRREPRGRRRKRRRRSGCNSALTYIEFRNESGFPAFDLSTNLNFNFV